MLAARKTVLGAASEAAAFESQAVERCPWRANNRIGELDLRPEAGGLRFQYLKNFGLQQ